MLIASLVNDAAEREGGRPAIVDADAGSCLSFTELRDQAGRVAAALEAAGLRAGDRVGLLHPNSIRSVLAETGIIIAGMVCVPLNARLSVDELRWQLAHAGAAGLVIAGDDADRARDIGPWRDGVVVLAWDLQTPAEPGLTDLDGLLDQVATGWRADLLARDPDLPVRLMYTSATTGTPKGVLVPQIHLHDNAVTTLCNQLRDLRPDDAYYAATPLTHMASGYLWPVLARGAATVVTRRFEVERFAGLVTRFGVTHTLFAPTMIAMLLRHLRVHREEAEQLRRSALRAIWYAGSPIPPGVESEALEVLGPVLNQQYGLTELFSASPAMCCTALYAGDQPAHPGACGRPTIGSLIRVVANGDVVPRGEVGDVEVRTRAPVGGYWKDDDATEQTFGGGWLSTGDVGWQDEEGFLYISDRRKDMIISGGFNVYSAEVEACLALHPSVELSAVVGVPDDIWGEVPWAVVVPRREAREVDSEDLIRFVRARLAHFKAPKEVLLWDELPISATGKILKREIRAQLIDGRS